MTISSFTVTPATDGFLNASEASSTIAIDWGISGTGSSGGSVLILIKDGSGNLLYWWVETSTSSTTLPAGVLGSYQGTIQIQAFQGTGSSDGLNSGSYTGTPKPSPTPSQFPYHDSSLSGGNPAVTSGTTADATTGSVIVDTTAPSSVAGITVDL